MIIKESPSDFTVREIMDLGGVGGEGRFAWYRVEKRNCSTIEVATQLAKALGASSEDIRFAGLKDKAAVTVQAMSVPAEIATSREKVEQPGRWVAKRLGYCEHEATSERLLGNRFEIVVRDLTETEAASFMQGLGEAAEFGIPNYFDDQRFGAARSGKGFPARELVLGRPEEALRLLVATPATIDHGTHLGRKEALARAWGDWTQCREIAQSFHEREVFDCLIKNPGGFEEALRFVPRRERLMQLFAYQSYLWNGALARLVRERCGANCVEIRTDMGVLPAWRRLTAEEMQQFETCDLRLPARGTVCRDAGAQAALESAARDDGIELSMLQIDNLRGFEFREEERPCVARADAVEADDPVTDDRHAGKLKVKLVMELPKGVYATLFLKRAGAAPA